MSILPPVLAALALALGAARAPAALAPLPADESRSTHGPYEMGACNACHDPADRASVPGRVRKRGNALCFDCHDDFARPMKGHPAPDDACLGCHSPHNARLKKLLLH